MRLAVIALLLLFGVFTAFAAIEESHSRIIAAQNEHDHAQVIREITALQAADHESFEFNNYRYLLARSYEASGDISRAVIEYNAILAGDSVLREYALWRLSQISRFTGNLFAERLYLQELLLFYPDSLLVTATKGRTARSHFESGNYASAVELLTDEYHHIPQPISSKATVVDAQARPNLAILANAFLYLGEGSKARDCFEKLVKETPNAHQPDDLSLEGVVGLDMLDQSARDVGQNVILDPEEHLRRAKVYQFNRRFADALPHYAAIVDEFSEHDAAAEAAYQIGRGLVQQERFTEAMPWLERVLEQFPNSLIAKDALLQAGSAYTRVGKHREAVSRYRRYIDRYPNDERVDRAYLNIIDIYRDSGEETEALRQAAAVQDVFRGKVGEAQALFAEARIHLSVENWELALGSLDRLVRLSDLGGSRVPGGTYRSEVEFLRALVLEKLQRFHGAIDIYLSIPDGRGEYYGSLATKRLSAIAVNPAATTAVDERIRDLSSDRRSSDSVHRRKAIQSLLRLIAEREKRTELIEELRLNYAGNPAYANVPRFGEIAVGRTVINESQSKPERGNRHKRIADELLFLGLWDEAAPELEATGIENIPGGEHSLAATYTRGDLAHRGVGFLEPLWRSVPDDFQVELIPYESVRLLYPLPHRKELIRATSAQNIDPRFVLSIMRQESRFRADAKSNAAARGLMQFIPQTAEQMARTLGVAKFRQDDLYDPETAVNFGAQFIGSLFSVFPNQPDAVAGSYNGGEDNMLRWKKRSGSDDPGQYVPEIQYSQTKDYVYKVMSNYRMYQLFYGPNLDRLAQ